VLGRTVYEMGETMSAEEFEKWKVFAARHAQFFWST
jgi:hypothetical protein